jgi:phospholipase/carboxylesterase
MKNIHSTALSTEPPIVISPQRRPQSLVIWLHGLGANGHDFVPLVSEMQPLGLDISTTKFIFPHAPFRPITLNHGHIMRGWYDIDELSFHREDEAGVRESVLYVQGLIEEALSQGISKEKIILAGFSQGGAIALYAGLTLPYSIGGILALSTYLPIAPLFEQDCTLLSQFTPICMIHGSEDSIIDLSIAERSLTILKKQGYSPEFIVYPMDHSLCFEEIQRIVQFLNKIIKN